MIPNRPIEIAMTHRVGANGSAQRFLRPKAVREIATRMQRWGIAAEACKSCQSLPAVRMAGCLALCGRCHTQRAERLGISPEGLAARADRATEPSGAAADLQGLAVVFNSKSVDMGFVEYIRPAAADRLISEKPDVRYLWNHNSDNTLGRASAGTLQYEKRTRGIHVLVQPPTWAEPYIESVSRRDITGQSFGFYVLDDDWHLEEGHPVREIFDMEIVEFSGVSFPAYPATTLRAVNAKDRSAEMFRQTSERLRLAR